MKLDDLCADVQTHAEHCGRRSRLWARRLHGLAFTAWRERPPADWPELARDYRQHWREQPLSPLPTPGKSRRFRREYGRKREQQILRQRGQA